MKTLKTMATNPMKANTPKIKTSSFPKNPLSTRSIIYYF